ncbi:hypothetical protein E4U42_002271 [Claviceps africana]|uniref:Cystathionine gamma-synthase n=1 Tax=Claviceps africana TaxID=83212 RepID=A0A8K0NHM3_9HYPO|nr:hypothetical protein E4U42_002271 [Claviceps africana]
MLAAPAIAPLPLLGHPIPSLPHAISVQLPKWQDVVDFARRETRVVSLLQGGYPRSFLHRNIRILHDICVRNFAHADDACLLLPCPRDAVACDDYIRLLLDRGEHNGVRDAQIRLRPLAARVRDPSGGAAGTTLTLCAIFFPGRFSELGMQFWRLTGLGISSRMAEDILRGNGDQVAIFETEDDSEDGREWPGGPAGEAAARAIRTRVADLLERSPVGGPREPLVRPDDVFLFPTGMAAIYHLTTALRDWPGTKAVVFGFPYELTLRTKHVFGKDCVFYGFGTLSEMELLEDYVYMLSQQDRAIQYVWCECASNPLLQTVDLDRMRRLADRYGFVLIVDDTIGCSANVDVLGVADVVVTSLTKSFSGYADVMGGSVALNPRSRYYVRLRATLAADYRCRLYPGDAVKLEENSRDMLARCTTMNANALRLVSFLERFARDPKHPLTQVYHPSIPTWCKPNYEARMRPATAEFEPGYGSVFTLEFDTVASSERFFNALDVCKGPSIGANFTLALPYCQVVFAHEKEWAAEYGVRETIVRVSVGVEDAQVLLDRFSEAIDVF